MTQLMVTSVPSRGPEGLALHAAHEESCLFTCAWKTQWKRDRLILVVFPFCVYFEVKTLCTAHVFQILLENMTVKNGQSGVNQLHVSLF